MATVELTAENFEPVIDGTGLALIDFWASWCGPCRMFAPVFERASERHKEAVFAKVDIEAEPALAASFGVTSVPTLVIIRDNVIVYSSPGALPAAALEELISRAAALDMDEVRAAAGGRTGAEPAGRA